MYTSWGSVEKCIHFWACHPNFFDVYNKKIISYFVHLRWPRTPPRAYSMELYAYLTLENPMDRTLFQLSTWPSELRSAILHHGPCRSNEPFTINSENGNMHIFSGKKHYRALSGAVKIGWQWFCFSPPMKKPLLSNCGNRMAMALLLNTDEEAILLLLVRRSIGNAKRVGQRCVGQPKQLRSEDQITRENASAPLLDAIIAFSLEGGATY